MWGGEWYGDEHVVDVHVGHLRRKLNDDANDPRRLAILRTIAFASALRHQLRGTDAREEMRRLPSRAQTRRRLAKT